MNISKYSLFVGGGLCLLTACQTPESGLDQAEIEKRLEQAPASGGSSELPALTGTSPMRPNAADLEKFLSKGEFAEPMDMTDATGTQEGSGISAAPLSKQAGYDCNIGFNSSFSLSFIPNKAHDSFAYSPHYMESCGNSAWAYILPTKRNHYHLGYENQYLCGDFTTTPGKVGVWSKLPTRSPPKCEWSVGTCNSTTADAGNYARYLHPHDYTDWVQIYVSRERVRKTFDLKSLHIRPKSSDGCYPEAGKIQLWVKKAATQQWWYWQELLPGYIWSPYPQDGSGLDEIQITSPNGYNWSVDDIKINVAY